MAYLKLFGGASLEASSGGPVTGRAVQRRRLALLALLAVARTRGMSRDKVLAYLWPDAETERGRHLLSDSIYRINQAFEGDAVAGVGDELRLNPQLLPSDVAEFEDAIALGDHSRAVALYTGSFLDGFFLSDAAEFERWAETERQRLSIVYGEALEALAVAAETAGDTRAAVQWWRRLATHDPYNSRTALRLMQALDASGQRAAAIQHARIHTTLLKEEFGADPDPGVSALAHRLKSKPPRGAPPPPAKTTDAPATAGAPLITIPDTPGSGDSTDGESFPSPANPTSGNVDARPATVRRRRVALVSVLLVAIVAVSAALVWARWVSGRGSAAALAHPAVAVLPFANLSPSQDDEYFSDGITEELINTLTRVRNLRVASRTSVYAFKGKPADVRDVGKRLGVSAVLEGSVRKAGNTLRITAQLVNVADGYPLWSEVYERELNDVFAIQEEISRAIVDKLAGTLGTRGVVNIAEWSTRHPQAYDLYLKGRYAWHQRTEEGLRRAADYFSEAVQESPDYARAFVGLGDAYAVLGFYDYMLPRAAFPKAEAAARRALEIDSMLAAPYATIAYVDLYYHWNWPRSEDGFRRAIALDPSYSTAHQWYANLLTAMGRFDEAERAMRRAQELDPLSLIANAALGWSFYHAGAYERAIEQCRRALELNPNFELAYMWGGQALEQLGRSAAAIDSISRAVTLSRGTTLTLAALAHALATGGARDSAQAILTTLEARAASGYVPSFEIAKVHLALGRRERALDWLERAYTERAHSMAFLKVEPQLRALRGEPRFVDLVKRVGLQ